MRKQAGALLVMALGVLGCASEITRYPAELSRARQAQDKIFVASQTVPVHPDSGYERSIKLGSEFVDAGGITQGSILKPTNAVFTIEGAHMHEAYLVVNNGRLAVAAAAGSRRRRGQVLTFALPKWRDVAFAVSRCVH